MREFWSAFLLLTLNNLTSTEFFYNSRSDFKIVTLKIPQSKAVRFLLGISNKKSPKYLGVSGPPGGSVCSASDSWLQLRSWSQSGEMKPRVGLQSEHGACFRFPLALCPSPMSHTLLLLKKKKSWCFFHNKYMTAMLETAALLLGKHGSLCSKRLNINIGCMLLWKLLLTSKFCVYLENISHGTWTFRSWHL